MRYLLDVNALIAFGVIQHQFHHRVVNWIYSQRGSTFMTTPLTEVGFVRIVANVAVYNLDVLRAKVVLEGMKDNTSQPLTFVPDADDVTLLPQWVKTPSHVTDGHLVQLARSNGAALATLDKGIPDAFLIPS